jgi:hypothetical protein
MGSINKRATARQQPMTTTEEWLGAMFSMQSMLRPYSESHGGNLASYGHKELLESPPGKDMSMKAKKNPHNLATPSEDCNLASTNEGITD